MKASKDELAAVYRLLSEPGEPDEDARGYSDDLWPPRRGFEWGALFGVCLLALTLLLVWSMGHVVEWLDHAGG
jgi:hypothetical protein